MYSLVLSLFLTLNSVTSEKLIPIFEISFANFIEGRDLLNLFTKIFKLIYCAIQIRKILGKDRRVFY